MLPNFSAFLNATREVRPEKNGVLNYDFPANHFTAIKGEPPKLNFSQLVEAKS